MLLWLVALIGLIGASAHVPQFPDQQPCVHIGGFDATVSAAYYMRCETNSTFCGVALPAGRADVVEALASDEGLVLKLGLRDAASAFGTETLIGCVPEQLCVAGEPTTAALMGWRSARMPAQGEVEPFTQSAYSLVHEEVGRASCQGGSYAVLLRRPADAPPIVFSAVVGKREAFTLRELVMFPVYMARVHGSRWSGLYRLHIVSAIALAGYLLWYARRGCCGTDAALPPAAESDISFGRWGLAAAATLAVWAYAVTIVDIVLHYGDALHEAEAKGASMGLFLALVLGLANLVPMWMGMLLMRQAASRAPCLTTCHAVLVGLAVAVYGVSIGALGSDAPAWGLAGLTAILALATAGMSLWRYPHGDQAHVRSTVACIGLIGTAAVPLVAFLGSGYWVGPVALAMASCLALSEVAPTLRRRR